MKRLILQLVLMCLFGMIKGQEKPKELVKVTIQIRDDHHQLTPSRVHLTDLSGTYYAPVGHSTDFPITFSRDQVAVEKDVMLADNRRFAYVDGTFDIDLPANNSYHLEVIKGFEYLMKKDTFEVSDTSKTLRLALSRAYHRPPDWYSGDVHVHHINPASALMEMKAEDLNVCNILISDFTKDHHLYRGSVEPISDSNHLIFLGQEYREDRLGHINLLNIKEGLVQPAKEMRQHQYPLNTSVSDSIHRQGGHISWAHFAAWPGLEGPLGLLLQKVDAVELLCTIDPFHPPIFVTEVVPELPLNSGLRLWYRLLNCGLKVPITAGTDKMGNLVTVGANRVYAKLDGPLVYEDWVAALTAGKTFVSNAPFLLLEVDGNEMGASMRIGSGDTLTINARVWSQLPIHTLEIVANGEMIANKEIGEGSSYQELTLKYRPQESVWIAARAYRRKNDYLRQGLSPAARRNLGKVQTDYNRYFGTLRSEVPFAHTSPVYISVDQMPIYNRVDAEYFIQYLDNVTAWLSKHGDFPSEAAKLEVLEKFAEGRAAFESLGH